MIRKNIKKRSVKQKRKQKWFLIGTVVVALVLTGTIIWKEQDGQFDVGDFHIKDNPENVIVYDGKEYVYNDHLSNYLFLGIDNRGSLEESETRMNAGQADAIFLVSHDRVKNTLQTLVIPRDTMTQIESFNVAGDSLGFTKDHINIQYAFGTGGKDSCELMKTAVSNLLFGLPIQKYCAINMDGIPKMVEAVGGVELTVPDDRLAQVEPEWTKGSKIILTEDNVERFVRYRDTGESQSALKRTERQKVFIQAYLEKVQIEFAKDEKIITRMYESIQDYMVTNMGNDLFFDLTEASMEGTSDAMTIPGEGVQGELYDEYHVDEDALYEMVLDIFYKEAE